MKTSAVDRQVEGLDPAEPPADGLVAAWAKQETSAKPGTSARWVAANRLNALKSTGPRTAAGKARSARNALRHGARAKVFELGSGTAEGGGPAEGDGRADDGLEGDAYAAHVAAVLADHRPRSVEEAAVVREVADAVWRGEQTARRQERAACALGPGGVTPAFLMAWLEADARVTGRLLVACRRLRRVVAGRTSAGRTTAGSEAGSAEAVGGDVVGGYVADGDAIEGGDVDGGGVTVDFGFDVVDVAATDGEAGERTAIGGERSQVGPQARADARGSVDSGERPAATTGRDERTQVEAAVGRAYPFDRPVVDVAGSRRVEGSGHGAAGSPSGGTGVRGRGMRTARARRRGRGHGRWPEKIRKRR